MAGSQVEALLAHLVEHNPQTRKPGIEGFGPTPDDVPFVLALRPPDVAHLRRQLVDWWSRPGQWQLRLAGQGRRSLPGWNDNHPGRDAAGAQVWIAQTMRGAELYWVSPEMCDVLISLAPSIPDCLPQPPVESAFVVFAKSIPGTDAETGDGIFTSAFLWGQVEMFNIGPCLSMESYAWRDHVAVYSGLPEKLQERYRQVIPTRLQPTGGSEWPYRAMISDFSPLGDQGEELMTASMIEDRRLLATFWALCSQKIAIETRVRPSRQVQRQAQRQGRKLDEIRVINLREPTRSSTAAGSEVEWSHRWIVGRHWRNQWYPSRSEHAPKLIEAYVKGPEDKPLKVRETVRALVR